MSGDTAVTARCIRRFWLISRWFAHRLSDFATARDDGDSEAAENLKALVERLNPEDGSPGDVWLAANVAVPHARQHHPSLHPAVSEVNAAFERVLSGPTPIGEVFAANRNLREAIDRDAPPETAAIVAQAAELDRLESRYEEKWRGLVEAYASLSAETVGGLRDRRSRLMNAFYRSSGAVLLQAVDAGGLFNDAEALHAISECFNTPKLTNTGNHELYAWLGATQRWLPSRHPKWGENYRQYPDRELDADLSDTERMGKGELLRMRAVAELLRLDAGEGEPQSADGHRPESFDVDVIKQQITEGVQAAIADLQLQERTLTTDGVTHFAHQPGNAAEAEAEPKPTAPRADSKQKRSPTVNDRMKAEMAADLEKVKGWTAQQWADKLGCAKSTVIETEIWRSLSLVRQQAQAERRNDRWRN